MKAAFFHDVKIIKGRDGKMYSVDFGYEVWERYLNVFDEVTVCTREESQDNIDLSKYKISSGKNVKFRLNKEYKTPLQFFTSRKKINKPIKQLVNDSQVCIVRLPSVIGVLAARECIKQNKPWAVEVVGCCWDSLWNYGNLKGKLFAPIMFLLNRYYISKANHVIYVSKEFLQKRYPAKGVVASASDVNIESIDEAILNKKIKLKQHKSSHDVTTLGLIGSLNVEYKGHRTAIMAVKELKDKGYNVKLRCLGGGDKTKWQLLSKELGVEDIVEFCGTLPSGDPVLEWLDDTDIFVMPSLQEGLPRSMVEAMSRGCNIIGARTGGIPELIQDEFIFSPKKYEEMANLIIKLIKDKDLAIEQSRRNFEEAKQYRKEKIEMDRLQFWNVFANDINI